MTDTKLAKPTIIEIGPRRTFEELAMPYSHEERMEWVRKSCERFFEKIREIDALLPRVELN